jgi:transcriptional regulator with XRE-family HTH domain
VDGKAAVPDSRANGFSPHHDARAIGGLGRLIVERRRELGMTQQELARRIGVPTANLSQIEHSASRWQSRLLWVLAEELRLPQIELALAAGIITDLPSLGRDSSEAADIDRLMLTVLAGREREGAEPTAATDLLSLIDALESPEVELIAAIARQFADRRRQPVLLPPDQPETEAIP